MSDRAPPFFVCKPDPSLLSFASASASAPAIVASDGKNVHVELELDDDHDLARMAHDGPRRAQRRRRRTCARAQCHRSVVASMAPDALSLSDWPNLVDGMIGRIIDERDLRVIFLPAYIPYFMHCEQARELPNVWVDYE